MDPLSAIGGVGGVSTNHGWSLPPVLAGGYASASMQWSLSGALLGGFQGGGFPGMGMGSYLGGGGAWQSSWNMGAFFGAFNWREPVTSNRPGKLWDVWFDHKAGGKTQQRSPLVLDLDGDRRPDITGKNVKGDGKVSGRPVRFDIDPRKDHWQYRSVRRRPGHGAPKVEGGHWETRDGRRLYLDKEGKIRGELREVGGRKMYFYGKRDPRERTEWLSKNGGDGLLVWDVNKDGKIRSSRELFGEFDTHGRRRFDDGYQKLAHHFDRNQDGRVAGDELKGLKVWKDRDADGKVDRGEMKAASRHGITSIDVENVRRKDMSSTFDREKTSYRDMQALLFGFWQSWQFGGCFW